MCDIMFSSVSSLKLILDWTEHIEQMKSTTPRYYSYSYLIKCLCFISRALSFKLLQEFIAGWMLHLATNRPHKLHRAGWGCIPGVPTGSPPISQHYSLISFSQTQKIGTFSRTSLRSTTWKMLIKQNIFSKEYEIFEVWVWSSPSPERNAETETHF